MEYANVASKQRCKDTTTSEEESSGMYKKSDNDSSEVDRYKPSSSSPRKADASDDLMMMALNTVQDVDVLLGRGRGNMTHPGNIFFQDLVRRYHEEYARTARQKKGCIAKKIVEMVKEQGGRFCMLDLSRREWIYLNDDQAFDKTGHALRYRNRRIEASSKSKSMPLLHTEHEQAIMPHHNASYPQAFMMNNAGNELARSINSSRLFLPAVSAFDTSSLLSDRQSMLLASQLTVGNDTISAGTGTQNASRGSMNVGGDSQGPNPSLSSLQQYLSSRTTSANLSTLQSQSNAEMLLHPFNSSLLANALPQNVSLNHDSNSDSVKALAASQVQLQNELSLLNQLQFEQQQRSEQFTQLNYELQQRQQSLADPMSMLDLNFQANRINSLALPQSVYLPHQQQQQQPSSLTDSSVLSLLQARRKQQQQLELAMKQNGSLWFS